MGRGALLLALVLPTSGCAYLETRRSDFADAFRARAAVGVGLYAEVEATSALRPCVGFVDLTLAPKLSVEHDPRVSGHRGEVRTAAFPALLLAWPFYGLGETREGYGDTSPFLRGFLAPLVLAGNYHVEHRQVGLLYPGVWLPDPRLELDEDEAPPPRASGATDHGWLGVSGTVLFGRFDFGVNLIELVDAVIGCAGLDLLGDDSTETEERQ